MGTGNVLNHDCLIHNLEEFYGLVGNDMIKQESFITERLFYFLQISSIRPNHGSDR